VINAIRSTAVRISRLNPSEAELLVQVVPEHATARTEIRGKLVGPHCHYASTVEIAYPLRTIPAEEGILQARIAIPEPSLWDPESPFLYSGIVELWQAQNRVSQAAFRLGLVQVRLGPRGLLVNGRPFFVRAAEHPMQSEADLLEHRKAGFNSVVVPATERFGWVWESADRLGYFVLGQIGKEQPAEHVLRALGEHASSLGWIYSERNKAQPMAGRLIGAEVQEFEPEPAPGVHFVVYPHFLPAPSGAHALPRIERVAVLPEPSSVPSGVLGWISTDPIS
jgi:hypothetical protein